MGTFSKIVAGPRQRRPVELPLPGARCDPETGKWEGPVETVDMRPLRPDEYTLVIQRAREYAAKRGVKDPGQEDEIFDRGRMLHTLAIACVDHDEPADKADPRPYFDGGVDQIDSSELMTPELVAYLYTHQTMLQDECSPLIKNQTPVEYAQAVVEMATKDLPESAAFFACMRPGMQLSFMRSMASQLLSLTMPESRSSSPSGSPPPTMVQ